MHCYRLQNPLLSRCTSTKIKYNKPNDREKAKRNGTVYEYTCARCFHHCYADWRTIKVGIERASATVTRLLSKGILSLTISFDCLPFFFLNFFAVGFRLIFMTFSVFIVWCTDSVRRSHYKFHIDGSNDTK